MLQTRQTTHIFLLYISYIDLILQSAFCHRHLPDAPPSRQKQCSPAYVTSHPTSCMCTIQTLSSSFDSCIKRTASFTLDCNSIWKRRRHRSTQVEFFLPKFTERSCAHIFKFFFIFIYFFSLKTIFPFLDIERI